MKKLYILISILVVVILVVLVALKNKEEVNCTMSLVDDWRYDKPSTQCVLIGTRSSGYGGKKGDFPSESQCIHNTRAAAEKRYTVGNSWKESAWTYTVIERMGDFYTVRMTHSEYPNILNWGKLDGSWEQKMPEDVEKRSPESIDCKKVRAAGVPIDLHNRFFAGCF